MRRHKKQIGEEMSQDNMSGKQRYEYELNKLILSEDEKAEWDIMKDLLFSYLVVKHGQEYDAIYPEIKKLTSTVMYEMLQKGAPRHLAMKEVYDDFKKLLEKNV